VNIRGFLKPYLETNKSYQICEHDCDKNVTWLLKGYSSKSVDVTLALT